VRGGAEVHKTPEIEQVRKRGHINPDDWSLWSYCIACVDVTGSGLAERGKDDIAVSAVKWTGTSKVDGRLPILLDFGFPL